MTSPAARAPRTGTRTTVFLAGVEPAASAANEPPSATINATEIWVARRRRSCAASRASAARRPSGGLFMSFNVAAADETPMKRC